MRAVRHEDPQVDFRARGGWLVFIVFAAALLAYSPIWLDLALLDLQFRLLRRVAPVEVRDSPVLIAADEMTLDTFPEPMALWHRQLGRVLEGLAQARPRAVGVDVELPLRSQNALSPGLDIALVRGLAALRGATVLVIARTVDERGRIKPVFAPYLAAVGASGTGVATWPLDADDRVRRFDERQDVAGATVPTLVGNMVRRLGGEVTEGYLDYSRGAPFGYLPLHEVLGWIERGDVERLRRSVEGRVVLIGAVLPFSDRHAQPVNLAGWENGDGPAPGLLLHAQALRGLMGQGLIHPVPASWVIVATLLATLAWFAMAHPVTGLGVVVVAMTGLTVAATALLRYGIHFPVTIPLIVGICSAIGRAGFDAWFHRRERLRLKKAFEGYVSPNVLALILRGHLGSQIGTGRRDVCVLFADIRDFTPLSERTDPERVVALLNRYFGYMTAAIHRHDGTVDNFRGDGIMSVFGAPLPTENPCLDGFRAAQAMLEVLPALNVELQRDGFEPIAMGVSLAFGEAVVGHIGAANRHEYTAIGDVANVSARLEAMTKEVGYPLVVSGAVADALRGIATFDDLGERRLKGHAPVRACGWPARIASEESRDPGWAIAHAGTGATGT